MKVSRRVFVGVLASALALTGCLPGSDDPAATSPTASTAPTTEPGGGEPGGSAAGCLDGTWLVDIDDLGRQIGALMQDAADATVNSSGSITLEFGSALTIRYDNATFKITTKADSISMTMRITFDGQAVSTDYSTDGGQLRGTMPAGGVQTSAVVDINGSTTPVNTTDLGGSLDLSDGALGYTCGGDRATLTNPQFTWKLNRA